MILVDTSVWIDHLRVGEPALSQLLERSLVLSHPWVVGEVALGGVPPAHAAMRLMTRLPQATVATHSEIMVALDAHSLTGSGIGYVDVQLIASTLLTEGSKLWTKDRRLAGVAVRLGCGYEPGAIEGAGQ